MQPLLKRRLAEDFADPAVAQKRAKIDTLETADSVKYETMRKIGREIEQEGKCCNQHNRDVSW
jgi:hypothetical protein